MFKKIVDIIENKPHHLELTDEMIEEIFNVGVIHGLFSETNFGFYDRKNSVMNLMSTLAQLNKKAFM